MKLYVSMYLKIINAFLFKTSTKFEDGYPHLASLHQSIQILVFKLDIHKSTVQVSSYYDLWWQSLQVTE